MVQNAPRSGWIIGRGWDHNDWKHSEFPTHHDLSRAFPDRPVVLTRVDGHVIIANEAAMKAARFDTTQADPKGGKIVRDSKGHPTGVFVDGAMELIRRATPKPTLADHKAAILRATEQVLKLGLTGIHEMGIGPTTVQAYKELDEAGKLPIRIWAYWAGDSRGHKPYNGRNFKLVGVKYFADGALGSRGAALTEAYVDAPETRGLLQYKPEKLAELTKKSSQAGFQIAIHAIGDRGIRVALDALRHAPATGLPHRIEHAQVVAQADFDRFVSQKIIASMQPTHCTSDMPWAEKRVGSRRILGAYAWRTMLNKGIDLVFGSDFPVESADPRKGLYAAITRQDTQAKPAGGWYPNQRLNAVEALQAFSNHAEKVVGARSDRGDFTVFNRNLATTSPQEILKARVMQVFVRGHRIYDGR